MVAASAALPPGALATLLEPPLAHPRVIAGEQNVRHGVPAPLGRAGVVGYSGAPSSAGLKDSSSALSAWPSAPGSLRSTASQTTIAASSPPEST